METNIVVPTGKQENVIEISIIQRIHEIRGVKVILDFDLAEQYSVETRRLNEAVKRNIRRFPPDFMFQLTKEEWENLMSQIATSSFPILLWLIET
jgi:predicted TIM-barrel fold metal-dependent hydrolase